MPKFAKGERVVIDGSLIATIQTYDEANDRIAYVSVPPGGGTNTTYGHISQTRVERLVTTEEVLKHSDELSAVFESAGEDEPTDEITGSASL